MIGDIIGYSVIGAVLAGILYAVYKILLNALHSIKHHDD